jgi:hypothetical protein
MDTPLAALQAVILLAKLLAFKLVRICKILNHTAKAAALKQLLKFRAINKTNLFLLYQ